MYKYTLFVIACIVFISSCRRDLNSSVFDTPVDERIHKTLSEYQSILASAPYGWVAALQPDTGNNINLYLFWFKFNDSNRVTSRYKNVTDESSYRLKAMQTPELIFDTYTTLHDMTSPVSNLRGASQGVGLKSDFEFQIQSASMDSLILIGKYHGTIAKLYRAQASDTIGAPTLPGYPLARSYSTEARVTIYRTPMEKGDTVQSFVLKDSKQGIPLKFSGTVAFDYLGFEQYISVSGDSLRVDINDKLRRVIKPGSFKVLGQSYNKGTGSFYVKTLYTRNGFDFTVEEKFSR